MNKRIYISPPHMSGKELDMVCNAFENNYIAPLGPMVDAFELEFSEYTGIKHCTALSSGTAAIHLALRYFGFGSTPVKWSSNLTGQGDEVFASTLTFIGSVTPVTFLGATPVFIDCDRETWNMDPILLERELELCSEKGKLPKAIVPTDLYGQCCDYDQIYKIGAKYRVPVIVDAAEAMGATYGRSDELKILDSEYKQQNKIKPQAQFNIQHSKLKIGPNRHAGKGAKAAVFSFNGNKIMTTSGGGMLASDDRDLIEHARFLSQQAREPFAHYEHKEIGYNYRMSNVLAAIGRGQLQVLDERVRRKREIFNYYYDAFVDVPGIEFMPEANYGRCNRWLTVILITPSIFGADREAVRLGLEKENMESRPVWKPMHMQPVFRVAAQSSKIKGESGKQRYLVRVVGGEVAEDLFKRGLCLPSGTAMSKTDLDRIIDVILSCHRP